LSVNWILYHAEQLFFSWFVDCLLLIVGLWTLLQPPLTELSLWIHRGRGVLFSLLSRQSVRHSGIRHFVIRHSGIRHFDIRHSSFSNLNLTMQTIVNHISLTTGRPRCYTELCMATNWHHQDWSPSPQSTPSPPPLGWYQRLAHSPAESCVCLAAAALADEWQYSSPQESSGVTPSKCIEPGREGRNTKFTTVTACFCFSYEMTILHAW